METLSITKLYHSSYIPPLSIVLINALSCTSYVVHFIARSRSRRL